MSEPVLGSLGLLMLISGIAGISGLAGGGGGSNGGGSGRKTDDIHTEAAGVPHTETALASIQGALEDRLGFVFRGDCEGGESKLNADGVDSEDRETFRACQPTYQQSTPHHRQELRRTRLGIGLALIIGLLAGSVMVPIRYAPKEPFRDGLNAISFACCFGPSVLLVTIAILPPYALARHCCGLRPAMPPLHVRTCLLPGIASGILWNIGNVGAVLTVLPEWGLTVGYPSTQGCLLVAGLWGIFVYGEIRGRRQVGGFFLMAVLLLVGAALLGIFGT
jgi:hypothetical protein